MLLSFFSQSQTSHTYSDTLTNEEVDYEFFGKTRYHFELAHARTLLTEDIDFKVNFIKMGVQFKKRYKTGIAFVLSRIYTVEATSEQINEVDNYNSQLRGTGTYFEYVWLENYRYYFSTGLDISSVYFNFNAFKNGDRVHHKDYKTARFAMGAFGVSGGYSINYWLVLAGGLGYRFAFSDHDQFNKELTTPYYSIGLKLKFGNLYKTIFHHDKVLKMKSIYFEGRNERKAKMYRDKYMRKVRRKSH